MDNSKSGKAIIEASIYKSGTGKIKIKFYNSGESTAKQLKVKVPKTELFEFMEYPNPFDLLPKTGNLEITFFVFEESPDTIDIELEWMDDFSDKNTRNITFQIPD